MIKFFLVALLCLSAVESTNRYCFAQIVKTFHDVKGALIIENTNQRIDAFADILNNLPKTIFVCLGEKAKTIYEHEVPQTCIADLDKAAKIGAKLLNETENQLIFSKDFMLLEHLVQTKIKKECPFLKDFNVQNLKDNAQCAEDAYHLSLVAEKLVGDFRKGDKKAVVSDFDVILSQLPAVLDTCGQEKWADLMRMYLPMDCVHSVNDFLAYVVVIEHNYEHFEWIIRNYKSVLAYVNLMRMNCPILF